jgi:hypothetical protein
MRLVSLRLVFSLRKHLLSSMTTDVRDYPLPLVKDFDGGWCRSNFHAFLHQRVNKPPVAEARPVVDDYFGTKITDPYRKNARKG